MKLVAAQVSNFRCVQDSGKFSLAPVTCLVGKNESGKTALLQAMHRLKPYDQKRPTYDKTLDYPRGLHGNYKERHPRSEAEVLRTTWALDAQDVKAVEAVLGKGVLASTEIEVSKRYGDGSSMWAVSVDQVSVIKHLAHEAALDSEELESIASSADAKTLLEHLNELESPSQRLVNLRDTISGFRNDSITSAAIDILSPAMPSFLYFSNYDRMSGLVSLSKLQTDLTQNTVSANDRVFLAFLEFAGTSLEEISTMTDFESVQARVEAASNAISSQVFEYWSQNQFLRVEFRIGAAFPNDPAPFNDGWVMRTRVYNELHQVTVGFDDRSAGFVWFFSFLVLFSQVRKQHGNVIILLDEPGLNLHGKAQGDLLRYIDEKLKPNHQVIYTTHSPFMVPHADLLSVRTVEDVVVPPERLGARPISLGTKVGDHVLSADADTLFPLQGALGYEITQTLFIGRNTLLVEGPSDVLMLQAASRELERRKRRGLSDKWTVCPVGGIGKVAAFVSLFGGNKLNMAVLTDYAKGDKTAIERVRSLEVLKSGRVFTAEAFCSQSEADLEDWFGSSLYASIVNQAFNLPRRSELSGEKLDRMTTSSERVTKRVAELFATMPASVPEFDHLTPSLWLVQHREIWDAEPSVSEAALTRFEAFFDAVNPLVV